MWEEGGEGVVGAEEWLTIRIDWGEGARGQGGWECHIRCMRCKAGHLDPVAPGVV